MIEETQPVQQIVEVDQVTLRVRVEEYKPPVEVFLKRPYLVWTGMPAEFAEGKDFTRQDSIPEVLRRMGPIDRTKYSDKELNRKYRNGGMVIQPDGKGGLEAYPVKVSDIAMNTKFPIEEALRLNPELARMIVGNSDLEELIQGGQVIGMVRSAPAQMIKLSGIGYPTSLEVVLPGKGIGQRKPVGEDGYLSIGKDREGQPEYYMVNCDEAGLPVNYLRPEDCKYTNGLPTNR